MRTLIIKARRNTAILAALALCAGSFACGLEDAQEPRGGMVAGGKGDGIQLLTWSKGCRGVSFPFQYKKPCASAPVYRCKSRDGALACTEVDYVRQAVDAITYGKADGLRTLTEEKAFLDEFSGDVDAWRSDESWAASCTMNAKLESFGLINVFKNLPDDRADFSTMITNVKAGLDAVDGGCSAWIVVMGSDKKKEGLACADVFTGDNGRCTAPPPAPPTSDPAQQDDPTQQDGPTMDMPGLVYNAVVDGVIVAGYETGCSSAKVVLTKQPETTHRVVANGTWEEERTNADGKTWTWTSAGNPNFTSCNHAVGGANDDTLWTCEIDTLTPNTRRLVDFVLTLSPGSSYRLSFDLGCY